MKFLNYSMRVTVNTPCEGKSDRCLNLTREQKSDSNNSGIEHICPGAMDVELGRKVNFCVVNLKDGRPFTIKVGDTTSEPLRNMRYFVYDGQAADIYISNTDCASIYVEYVTGRYQK